MTNPARWCPPTPPPTTFQRPPHDLRTNSQRPANDLPTALQRSPNNLRTTSQPPSNDPPAPPPHTPDMAGIADGADMAHIVGMADMACVANMTAMADMAATWHTCPMWWICHMWEIQDVRGIWDISAEPGGDADATDPAETVCLKRARFARSSQQTRPRRRKVVPSKSSPELVRQPRPQYIYIYINFPTVAPITDASARKTIS